MNIDFTKDELNALLSLIDIAVKAAGLSVTQNAFVLATKINAELNALPAVQLPSAPMHNGAATPAA
jgi:hypothetical protein